MKEVIKGEGYKPITIEKGGLHKSTHTPLNEKIPASKKAAALRGEYGKAAKRQANFAKNVLTGKK